MYKKKDNALGDCIIIRGIRLCEDKYIWSVRLTSEFIGRDKVYIIRIIFIGVIVGAKVSRSRILIQRNYWYMFNMVDLLFSSNSFWSNLFSSNPNLT